ncbi:hypothetical protein RSAG8_00520, partial [Rhizoctonia solani AG-8 WAC10335]
MRMSTSQSINDEGNQGVEVQTKRVRNKNKNKSSDF